jgi:hypothetical protein
MTWTMLFTVIGVCFVSCRIMDIIVWLDSPKGARK